MLCQQGMIQDQQNRDSLYSIKIEPRWDPILSKLVQGSSEAANQDCLEDGMGHKNQRVTANSMHHSSYIHAKCENDKKTKKKIF